MTDEALTYAVEIHRRTPLERVTYLAEQIDHAELALTLLRGQMAEAMRDALETETRDAVAEAAHRTPAGMYKALARVYGQRRPTPRRNPRPAGIDI